MNVFFCLRQDKDDVCGQELWLESEDFTAQDVIEQYKEILRKAQNDGIQYVKRSNFLRLWRTSFKI